LSDAFSGQRDEIEDIGVEWREVAHIGADRGDFVAVVRRHGAVAGQLSLGDVYRGHPCTEQAEGHRLLAAGGGQALYVLACDVGQHAGREHPVVRSGRGEAALVLDLPLTLVFSSGGRGEKPRACMQGGFSRYCTAATIP